MFGTEASLEEKTGMSLVYNYSSSKKKDNWNVFSVVCLRSLKAHYRLKGELNNFLTYGVTYPNQGF
jgi:hypothetical protein